MPKRDGDSFSKEVMVRILQILLENGKLRKTHLAGKARINYKMCIKYLNFLDKLNWIETISDSNNFECVSITPEGTDSFIKLKNEHQKNTGMSHSIAPCMKKIQSLILLPQETKSQHLTGCIRKKLSS